MQGNRRRLSRKTNQDWQQQRVGDQTRYLLTEDGSTFVVARQSTNAFCWEEPTGPAPEALNPGEPPVSAEEALRRTLHFLRRVYRG